MKAWVQRILWTALGIVVVAVITALLAVFFILRTNEMTGLTLVDSWKEDYSLSDDARSKMPPDRWTFLVRETPAVESKRNPNLQMVRFLYRPSFHPNVCNAAWKDGDECWIRSTVRQWDQKQETHRLWQRTEPLPLSKWNDLVTALQRKTVNDPLNGAIPSPGLDGSSWHLESSIGGRTTSASVDNPVTSKGLPNFEFVSPRFPAIADFVDTCRHLLELGGVKVPEMY